MRLTNSLLVQLVGSALGSASASPWGLVVKDPRPESIQAAAFAGPPLFAPNSPSDDAKKYIGEIHWEIVDRKFLVLSCFGRIGESPFATIAFMGSNIPTLFGTDRTDDERETEMLRWCATQLSPSPSVPGPEMIRHHCAAYSTAGNHVAFTVCKNSVGIRRLGWNGEKCHPITLWAASPITDVSAAARKLGDEMTSDVPCVEQSGTRTDPKAGSVSWNLGEGRYDCYTTLKRHFASIYYQSIDSGQACSDTYAYLDGNSYLRKLVYGAVAGGAKLGAIRSHPGSLGLRDNHPIESIWYSTLRSEGSGCYAGASYTLGFEICPTEVSVWLNKEDCGKFFKIPLTGVAEADGEKRAKQLEDRIQALPVPPCESEGFSQMNLGYFSGLEGVSATGVPETARATESVDPSYGADDDRAFLVVRTKKWIEEFSCNLPSGSESVGFSYSKTDEDIDRKSYEEGIKIDPVLNAEIDFDPSEQESAEKAATAFCQMYSIYFNTFNRVIN